MKYSGAKKASITLPQELERALRQRAKKEQRTISGLVQEATRHYLSIKEFEELQREVALQAARIGLRSEEDVNEAVHAVRRS